MRKILSLLIFAFFAFNACKKKDEEKNTKLSKITELFVNRPLLEIGGDKAQQISYYHVVPYGTGIVLYKANYSLIYEGQHLKAAKIDGDFSETNVGFTFNTQGLITESNFDTRKTLNYSYDNKGYLISVRGDYIFEYEYSGQNVSKVVAKYANGIKITETSFIFDDKINPIYKLPLIFLEESIPIWGYFFLSKNNIISSEISHFDKSGNVTSKDKYLFEYDYDQKDRPLRQRRYYKEISGAYQAFEYTYQ